ncbi:zinc-ribbon domain-containing protein [Tenuibacillus multivorans]
MDMSYCPKCGAKTYEEEQFCVSCGSQLPDNITERYLDESKGFNKWWFAPISVVIFVLVFAIGIHFYLEHQQNQAVEIYQEGVELANEGQYINAKEKFEQSLDYKSNYQAASTSLTFMDVAIEITQSLESIEPLIEEGSYQQAFKLTHDNESKLSQYNGEVVNQLLTEIVSKRNEIQIAQIQDQLDEDASIDELKMQLWKVESIKTEEANELESQMKERIVNHSFNQASSELSENQFSTALGIVDDALRYIPDNERLQSLKTTIERERIAFETEQQERIEQALNQYEMEQEQNANSAVELVNIEASTNEEGDTVVKGEIKSIATVPIYSISVKYTLHNQDGDQILENETFVFPETLYPEESGEFEYTHFDIEEDVVIDNWEIKWYLEGE